MCRTKTVLYCTMEGGKRQTAQEMNDENVADWTGLTLNFMEAQRLAQDNQ